jgi:hypothetical protein
MTSQNPLRYYISSCISKNLHAFCLIREFFLGDSQVVNSNTLFSVILASTMWHCLQLFFQDLILYTS